MAALKNERSRSKASGTDRILPKRVLYVQKQIPEVENCCYLLKTRVNGRKRVLEIKMAKGDQKWAKNVGNCCGMTKGSSVDKKHAIYESGQPKMAENACYLMKQGVVGQNGFWGPKTRSCCEDISRES